MLKLSNKVEFTIDHLHLVYELENNQCISRIITVPNCENWTGIGIVFAEMTLEFDTDKVPNSIYKWNFEKGEWEHFKGKKLSKNFKFQLPIISQ